MCKCESVFKIQSNNSENMRKSFPKWHSSLVLLMLLYFKVIKVLKELRQSGENCLKFIAY